MEGIVRFKLIALQSASKSVTLAMLCIQFGCQPKNESSPMDCFFVFGTMCSACTERDAHFVRDDGFAL